MKVAWVFLFKLKGLRDSGYRRIWDYRMAVRPTYYMQVQENQSSEGGSAISK